MHWRVLKKKIIHINNLKFLIYCYDQTTMWGNQTLIKLALPITTHGELAKTNNFNIHKQI
jgi:hypothetical protein